MRSLLRILLAVSLGFGCKGEAPEASQPATTPTAARDTKNNATASPVPFAADIERFERMDADSPVAPGSIVFVGSSSIRRWSAMAKANSLMQAICETSDTLEYIDVASHLFTGDGALRPEAFVSDGIHLSELSRMGQAHCASACGEVGVGLSLSIRPQQVATYPSPDWLPSTAGEAAVVVSAPPQRAQALATR
tara:strand:+ start:58633 stop:59211 length:579 start_codon:yes stop_codon:yes gene_type:complete